MNIPFCKVPVCQSFGRALNVVSLNPPLGCVSLDGDVRKAREHLGLIWLFLHVLLEANGSDTHREKPGAERAH